MAASRASNSNAIHAKSIYRERFPGTGQTFKNVQQSTTAIPTWLHHGTQGLPYGKVSSATSAVSQRFSQPASKNTMHAVSKLNMTMRIQSGSLCRSGNRAFTANRPIRQFFPIGKSGICVGMGSNRAIGCFLRIGQPGFYNHSDNCFWIGQVVPIGQLPQSGIGCHSCNPSLPIGNQLGRWSQSGEETSCSNVLHAAQMRHDVRRQIFCHTATMVWSINTQVIQIVAAVAFYLVANELQGLFRFFSCSQRATRIIPFFFLQPTSYKD